MSDIVRPSESSDLYAARNVLIRRYLGRRLRAGRGRLPPVERGGLPMGLTTPTPAHGAGAPVVGPFQVHGVGIGGKNDTTDPAVVVYVIRKLPRDMVPADQLVPETIDGVRTDVVESRVARLAGCSERRRAVHRPLIAGISVGRNDGPSGTLAAFARSTRTADGDALFLLSNSHVLFSGRGKPENVRVVQPAPDDGSGGIVATLARATRLTVANPITADAAIARVHDAAAVRNEVCSIGPVRGTAEPRRDTIVEKHGRTSGHTTGRIVTVGLAAVVEDGDRSLQFVNAFRVESGDGRLSAVATRGDSGALVLEQGAGTAVGLLFAADELQTFYLAQPIDDVCKELEIALKVD